MQTNWIARGARTFILSGVLLIAFWGHSAMAGESGDSDNGRVAAIVNGKPVYLNDLNSAEIAKTRRQLYSLERAMLQKIVLEKLRKEKPKEFSEGKIYLTEDDIRRVYNEAGLSSRGTLDSFRDRIRDYLIQGKTRKLEDGQFNEAVRKGYVTSRLTPPPAYHFRLARVNRPETTLGPVNAAITVVEFSDFQ